MPYHVVVSRQVLLDGLMTLCATAALYCVVRYVEGGRLSWLLAGGSMMGAAVLSKETSIVLLGGLYAFFVLTPSARMRVRHLLLTLGLLAAEIAVWPLMIRLSGHSRTGQNYLLWQMFRRPNHPDLLLLHGAAHLDRPDPAAGCRGRSHLAAPGGHLAGTPADRLAHRAGAVFHLCGRSRALSTCCRSARRSPSWLGAHWPARSRDPRGSICGDGTG